MTTAKSLLHVAFTSNATAQQPNLNSAMGNATGSQQAPVKAASLLDIARNKLRNKHATSTGKGTQQAEAVLRGLVLEVMALVGEPPADWQSYVDAALADPVDAMTCYTALKSELQQP